MFLRHLLKTRNVYDHRHKTLKAWHVSSLTNIWNGQDTVKRGEITHTRIKDTVPTLGNKLRDKLQNKTQIETPDASADSSTNSSVYKTVTCVSSTMQVSCGWHRHKTWYRTRRWVSHDLSVCLSLGDQNCHVVRLLSLELAPCILSCDLSSRHYSLLSRRFIIHYSDLVPGKYFPLQ
jgi:hypothetical protein